MMAAPMYREVSTRGADAAFVLEDLTVRFKQDTVVYYSSLDYQLPLLSSNALYRCGLDKSEEKGRTHHMSSA